MKLNTTNLFWITAAHILALIGIVFFWSWGGLAIAVLSLLLISPLGINLGYHRLMTHRALVVPKWLEYTLVTIGAMCGGGSPIAWAGAHRRHHRYANQELDPYNSSKGFWHSHILHLFIKEEIEAEDDRYVPDLYRDNYLVFLSKYWIWAALAVLVLLYFIGGIQLVLWGGFVRVVLMWHATWFVNSAAHMWGYRNYDTNDKTTNCWWVGLIAAGEGWHNNHHANPRLAAHGHRWWELDFTYAVIWILEKIGLATKVKR